MKQHGSQRCYLDGNMLIIIEDEHRTTRGFQADQEAAEAYNALPGAHREPQWPVQTRLGAARAGEKYYYTGRLCAHNHDARRYVSSGVCSVCNTNNVKRYQQNVRDALKGAKDA